MATIQQLINSKGRKQKELMPLLGLSESQVSKLINNREKMSLAQLIIVSEFLNMPLDVIAGERDPDEDNLNVNGNFRSRQFIRDELERVDKLSIRYLREMACESESAPDGLRRLEQYADSLRAEMEAAF